MRFQLIILSTNCLKFFFSPYYLSYLAGVQNISEICLDNDCTVVQAPVAQKVDNFFNG